MAKVQPDEQPVAEVVAEQPTPESLMAELQTALSKGDFKAVAAISHKIDTITKTAEKAELEAKRAVLDQMVDVVKEAYIKFRTPLVESGQLDAADGIWIADDFGEVNPTVRLMKSTTRAPRAGGGGTGKKFDVSTDALLSKYGTEPYKDSGMNFQQAYESNTDKNFRYAIRQALLKKDGII